MGDYALQTDGADVDEGHDLSTPLMVIASSSLAGSGPPPPD